MRRRTPMLLTGAVTAFSVLLVGTIVMLRRQQAEAVVAARARIVDGAVGMVKLGIEQLEAEGVVKLSSEDRVKLVTNLMTVLVSESETHPVLSVGKE